VHNNRRINLDSKELQGRARGYTQRPLADVRARTISDISSAPKTQPKSPEHVVKAQQVHQSQLVKKSVNNIQKVNNKSASAHSAHLKLRQTPRVNHSITSGVKKTTPINLELPLPKETFFKKIIHSIQSNKKGYALSAMAVLLFTVGAAVNINSFLANKKIEAVVQAQNGDSQGNQQGGGSSRYDETPVTFDQLANYVVGKNDARYLKIEDIGVFARVIHLGLTPEGAVDSPQNVFDAGWYNKSARPGEKGATFIDGHYSGYRAGGIFSRLDELNNGDKVQVERGDGKTLTYTVVAKERFDKDKVNMRKVLSVYGGGEYGLNLMTCAGDFIQNSETFDERLVVYTILEN
jgi:LPXTG-site transpeptidase (sortase) family protein